MRLRGEGVEEKTKNWMGRCGENGNKCDWSGEDDGAG